jgi:soluble lytic murein transglycosylase
VRALSRRLAGRAGAGRAPLGALVAAAALLTAACGGSGSESIAIEALTPTPTPARSTPTPVPPTPTPTVEQPAPGEPGAAPPAELEAIRDRVSSLGAAADGALGAASSALDGEAEALARAHYRAGVAARDEGAPDEAAAAFARALDAGGPLAPVARLRLGQQLHAAGDSDAAAERLVEVVADPDVPAVLRSPARLDLAAVLDGLGRGAESLAVLDALAGDAAASVGELAEGRWRAFEARRALGDSAWIDDAQALLRLTPGSGRAQEALSALEAADAPVAPLTGAYVLYLAHADASAAASYEAAHDSPSAAAAEQAVASFYLAAIAERAGDVSGALAGYARAIAEDPAGRLADDAHWWRALLLEADGEPAAAAEAFAELVARHPRSRFADEAAIRGPLALAGAGETAAALDGLRTIAETQSGERAATASRWHALLRAETGAAAAALPSPSSYDPTALGSLLEGALASSGEAATLRLPPAAAGEWAPNAGDEQAAIGWLDARFGAQPAGRPRASADAELGLALLLADIGESAVARALLGEVTARYRDQPHELYAVATAASAAGLVDWALWATETLLRPLDHAARAELPAAIAALAYPAPFGGEVLDAASAEGVPPLLLLALVRQESAFNPGAGSSAQAYGLTQVIGPTGRQIAASLGVPWEPALLFEPASSLRFGAHYLATQLDAFDGDVLAALAAYNGGPANASRWRAQQQWPGPDGYVVAVDFAETRLYLELVLANYAWYRYYHGAAPAPALR